MLLDRSLKTRWYRTAAEIEIELHQRLHKTKSGKPPLRYFDGSVMESYQIPPKVVETNFCRQQGEDTRCGHGLRRGIIGKQKTDNLASSFQLLVRSGVHDVNQQVSVPI